MTMKTFLRLSLWELSCKRNYCSVRELWFSSQHTQESFQPTVTGHSEDLRPFSGLHGHKQLCKQNRNPIKYNMNKTFEISLWIPEMFMFREVTYSPISPAQLWIFVGLSYQYYKPFVFFLGIYIS